MIGCINNILTSIFSSVNFIYVHIFFRQYESQEPGTYTLYRNMDDSGNINEVLCW